MERLRDRMIQELRIRGKAERTVEAYVHDMRLMTERTGLLPGRVTEQDIKAYLEDLREVRQVAPSTFAQHVAAIRFFYPVTTLARATGLTWHARAAAGVPDPRRGQGAATAGAAGRADGEPNHRTTLPSGQAVRTRSATLRHAPVPSFGPPPTVSRPAPGQSTEVADPVSAVPAIAAAPATWYPYCGARGLWTLYDPMSRPVARRQGSTGIMRRPGSA